MHIRLHRNDTGAALYMTVVVLVVFVAMTTAMVTLSISQKEEREESIQHAQRRLLAEAGISDATALFRAGGTGIVDHANRVATRRIPGGLRTLLPGYTDELARALGLLDAEGSVDEIRARYRVNERVRRHAGRPDFSIRIREGAST